MWTLLLRMNLRHLRNLSHSLPNRIFLHSTSFCLCHCSVVAVIVVHCAKLFLSLFPQLSLVVNSSVAYWCTISALNNLTLTHRYWALNISLSPVVLDHLFTLSVTIVITPYYPPFRPKLYNSHNTEMPPRAINNP